MSASNLRQQLLAAVDRLEETQDALIRQRPQSTEPQPLQPGLQSAQALPQTTQASAGRFLAMQLATCRGQPFTSHTSQRRPGGSYQRPQSAESQPLQPSSGSGLQQSSQPSGSRYFTPEAHCSQPSTSQGRPGGSYSASSFWNPKSVVGTKLLRIFRYPC